ncbi:MAG: hypothetical protein ACXV5H_09955 [Halobacteriota archaeon]
MRQAFDGLIYDTETATLIARNELPDTIEYLKGHRNRYLYRSPEGSCFLYMLNKAYFGVVSDPDPEILPLTAEQAIAEYENLEDQFVTSKEAFSDVDFSKIGFDINEASLQNNFNY